MISAYPRDINAVPGHSGDNRTLDKLVDGVNTTCNDNHMWLAPFLQNDPTHANKPVGSQWLKIVLPAPVKLVGVKVYVVSTPVSSTNIHSNRTVFDSLISSLFVWPL